MGSFTQRHEAHHTVYRKPGLADDAPIVVLVSGQHGNEPLGLELGWQLADRYKDDDSAPFELRLFGAVNPWGLARNVREMCPESERSPANGQGDMNRSWGGPDAPRDDLERELWSVLISGRPVLLLDLHSQHGMPQVYYDGHLGAGLKGHMPEFLFLDYTRPGCLSGACEAAGIPALTIEASSGHPIGYMGQYLWNGVVRLAKQAKAVGLAA